MRQKGFAPVIIIIIVALVAGLAYWGYKSGIVKINLPQSMSTITYPTPTTNPTANWKTYTDTSYKYSVNYPPDWQIEPLCYGGQESDHYICVLSPDYIGSPGPLVVERGGVISIGSIDESLGFGQTADEFCTSSDLDKIQDCEETTIGALKGLKRSFQFYNFIDVGILKNNKIVFSFRVYYVSGSKEKTLNIFNQVLSTFKFAE